MKSHPVKKHELVERWQLVVGSFFGVGGGFASLYVYSCGLFLKPLQSEFGWSRGQAALGPLFATLTIAMSVPLAGRLMDLWGARRIAIFSVLGLAASFALLASVTRGLMGYLLLSILLSFISVGSTPLSYSRIIVSAFERQRGIALGLAQTGGGAGAVLIPPLLLPVITAYGWRNGYIALALVALALAIPVAALLRTPRFPVDPRRSILSLHIIKSWQFWSLGIMIFLASFAILGMIVHLVPLLTDRGMTSAQTARIASALGFALIGGRVVTGWMLDRFDAGWVTAGVFLGSAGGAISLLGHFPHEYFLSAALIGVGIGSEVDLLGFLVARKFPLQAYGTAYGGVAALHSLGLALGPATAAALFDRNGNYDCSLILSAAALILAALIAIGSEHRTTLFSNRASVSTGPAQKAT